MKKILLISSVAFLGLILPLTSVFGQSDEDINEFPIVYAESILRDKNGDLIVYKENYSIQLLNNFYLNQLLDQEKREGNNATLIDIGGVTHEMITIKTSEVFTTTDLRGWDALGIFINDDQEQYERLALFLHEGYPVIPGDELTIFWTFVRIAS